MPKPLKMKTREFKRYEANLKKKADELPKRNVSMMSVGKQNELITMMENQWIVLVAKCFKIEKEQANLRKLINELIDSIGVCDNQSKSANKTNPQPKCLK